MDLNQTISGALYDFLGYLTTREEVVTLSRNHTPHDVISALGEWAADRGLDLDQADVMGWNDTLKKPLSK